MGSILDFAVFECIVADCPLFVGDTIWSGVFVIMDYYPTILTVLMYAFSLYYYELYTFLVGLVLSFDFLLNWGLRYAIATTSRYPGCGTEYEMPSFSSQHACVFLTMIFTFFSLWNKVVPPHRLILLNVVVLSVITARVFIGINTPLELFVGAVVGVAEGIVFQLIIYYMIYPHFTSILKWRFVRVIGLEDNICGSHSTHYGRVDMKDKSVQKVISVVYDEYVHTPRPGSMTKREFTEHIETVIGNRDAIKKRAHKL
jgi:hypothetical protein